MAFLRSIPLRNKQTRFSCRTSELLPAHMTAKCQQQFVSLEQFYNHLFCVHPDSVCLNIRDVIEDCYSRSDDTVFQQRENYAFTRTLLSSFKPCMPMHLAHFDVIIRTIIRAAVKEQSIIYFDIESLRWTPARNDISGQLGTMIGHPGITDIVARQLIESADLTLIPFYERSTYGGHVVLIMLTRTGAYSLCASGSRRIPSWISFLKRIYSDAPASPEILSQIKAWSHPTPLVSFDAQSKVVSLEYACGLVTMYVIAEILKSACVQQGVVPACLFDAMASYTGMVYEMERAENQKMVKLPKLLLRQFIVRCALGFFKTRWEIRSYPAIQLHIGTWAASPAQRIEGMKEFGGVKFYLVKHLGFAKIYNTYVPDFLLSERLIRAFESRSSANSKSLIA